jgi:hypothetical protein
MSDEIYCAELGCMLSREEYDLIIGGCGDSAMMGLIEATGLIEAVKPLELLVEALDFATEDEKAVLLAEHNIQFKAFETLDVDAIVDQLIDDAPVPVEAVKVEIREFVVEGDFGDVVNLNERYAHNKVEWKHEVVGGVQHAPFIKTTLVLDGVPTGFAVKPTNKAGKRSVARGMFLANKVNFSDGGGGNVRKRESGTGKVHCDKCGFDVNPDGHDERCVPAKLRVSKDFAFERVFGDQVFDVMASIAISLLRGKIKGSKLVNACKVALTNRDWMAKLFRLLICAGAVLPKKAHDIADLFEVAVVIKPNLIRVVIAIMVRFLKRQVLDK